MRLRVALATVALSAGLAAAQDAKKVQIQPRKADDPVQKTFGVISKIEEVKSGASEGSTTDRLAKEGKQPARSVRLTLKTDAVWRDFVRDQASLNPPASTEAAAKKGQQSIATKGQPSGEGNMVVIDVGPKTQLETRFRSASDETDAGSKTPAEAVAKEKGEKADPGRSAATPTKVEPADLKAGLWVEVEYQHADAQNQASRIIVVRPVGGPQSPASTEVPKGK